jgi:hypothetical protein
LRRCTKFSLDLQEQQLLRQLLEQVHRHIVVQN